MFKKKEGFTLIELLIVISVIAILASIIIPSFRGMQQEGDIVAAQGDLNTLKTAIESYYLHHSRTYPTSLTELISASPQIVTSMPKDRFSTCSPPCDYDYTIISGTNYYIIWSNGPNETKDYGLTTDTPPKIDKSSVKDDIITTNLSIE